MSLRYLGPTTSVKYDTGTQAYDTLNGDLNHDQPILANSFWLATDTYQQTYWGDAYMPFTLNGWHGGIWYESAASASTTSSQAWGWVDFDMNYTHPIAENPVYRSTTFYPPGFTSGQTYYHWDTIMGDNSSFQTGIAQSWPYAGAGTRTPYYWEPWYLQWSAISANQGFVW